MKDVIELQMFERKLKQKDLTELLETSASRISEYLNGKSDITIEIARALCFSSSLALCAFLPPT